MPSARSAMAAGRRFPPSRWTWRSASASASLKIKHHAQLGYVLEAPAGVVEHLRAQPGVVLRQATAGGGRFSTPELADLDRRIGEAGERAAARERLVWDALWQGAMRSGDALAASADALALLDVLQSCARLAEDGRWCAPGVTEGTGFRVAAGRHPVVERALPGAAAFVANGCDLAPGRRVLLLTGPNMAGKSTFLRQNALIVVLAQAGLPVPAESAELGVVDRLFSRVGAADDLARGQSTFMAEMLETAAILNQAGPRSFVVVDEIGRGTGTRDGLAIAWAVLEALHDSVRCRVLFATHFHELAGLAGKLPRAVPAYDARAGVEGRRRVPARGWRGCGWAELGRARRQARGRASPGRAPGRLRCCRRSTAAGWRTFRCSRRRPSMKLW